MNEWKSGENKRYYELLLTMAKPYLGDNQSILKTYEGSRSNALSIYPMALEIPTIPVIAPNGRVYEKEIIESHLTLQSKKIKQERQRFEEPEYTWHETQVAREFIDSVIASCSFSSRELFSKKHLTYASQFTKMLIEKLNLIKEEISDNSSLDQQMKIDQILQHYIGLDQSAGMQLVLKLSTALFDKGATEEQCRAIAQAYTLHAKAQKVIRKH